MTLRLRAERLRRGWSMTRVAGLTGISPSDLSQLERGLRPAFPGWRRRLSDVFGVSEGELFAREEAREERASS
ncbi:MAG: helix-turn-helix transcriptional regulator [Acidobacteria bacterium]|nr:helix-turn-helix transcriptional regulator [Acidobacteriota bacterium]